MSTNQKNPDGEVRSRPKSSEIVERAKLLWNRTRKPDAIEYLSNNSQLMDNRSLVIELAYEEYCARRDQGERVNREQFCQRFPSIARSLYRQLEVDQYMREHEIGGEPDWPAPDEELMEFRVVGEVGRGTFARAYLCSQYGVGDRQVIVKVSRFGKPEADTMGVLNHPNIMPIYSVQEDPETGTTIICMPFVGRSTLLDVVDGAYGTGNSPNSARVILDASRSRARRGDRYHHVPANSLRPKASYVSGVLRLVRQLASALSHAHHCGVIHGDLKPSNIVMSTNGVPFLVDFNLSQSSLGVDWIAGGTLPYMSPEQIRLVLLGADPEYPIDHRSDIYSLGAILYELLYGAVPFQTESSGDGQLRAGEMLDVQAVGVTFPSQSNQFEDFRLRALIRRCLAFNAADRPASMDEVLAELDRCDSLIGKVTRFMFVEHRTGMAMAALLTLGLAAFGTRFLNDEPAPIDPFTQAIEHYQASDFDLAITDLNSAIADDPDNVATRMIRGCAAIHLYEESNFAGWLDQAFDDFIAVERINSTVDMHGVRGYVLLLQEKPLLAISEFEKRLDLGFESPDAWNNLGLAYEKSIFHDLGNVQRVDAKLDKAEQAYIRSIELDAGVWEPRFNLALLTHRRSLDASKDIVPYDGLEQIRKAIALGGSDSPVYRIAAKLVAQVVNADGATPEMIEECLLYIDLAIDNGLSLRNNERFLRHFEFLRDLPEFNKLLSRKPGRSASTAMQRCLIPRMLEKEFDFSSLIGT